MQLELLALSFVIIFLSGLVQGTTSFGFSLIALPLLSIFLPLKLVVPMLIVFSIIMNSIILYEVRKSVKIKRIIPLIIGGLIATPIGVNMLMYVDETLLKLIVGIVIVISAILMYFNIKIEVKRQDLAFVPVGFASGLLNGCLGISGPPVILFLTNIGVSKKAFRATLTAYFWILNIITVATYLFKGLITTEVIKTTAILMPAMLLGVILGIRSSRRIKEEQFRKVTLALILVMGICTVGTAL